MGSSLVFHTMLTLVVTVEALSSMQCFDTFKYSRLTPPTARLSRSASPVLGPARRAWTHVENRCDLSKPLAAMNLPEISDNSVPPVVLVPLLS